jgi:tRNA modification GTPase
MEHQPPHRGTGRPGAQLNRDTIVAAATPPGRGGVGIVRISGPAVTRVAVALLGALPPPRHATLAGFRDAAGETLDNGLALYFPAPHSYTGEDVLELHGHGGPVVMNELIERAVALGTRRALPGEFTQRAYLNDKLDLAQAEAVADLIDAGSTVAARAAMRSLQGDFSAAVQGLVESLTELRAHVEAAIDFPEEEIDFLGDAVLLARFDAVRAQFGSLAASAGQGRLLTEGMTVVIAGPPNAGKSTLLNRLVGFDAAIVTDVPGTTRDVLRERMHIDGMPLHIIDTAGLRETRDVIETEGIRRAELEMARADRVLFVVDVVTDPAASALVSAQARLPAGVPVTLVLNKLDALAPAQQMGMVADPGSATRVTLSAKTGAGMEALRQHLKDCMGYQGAEGSNIAARGRHVEALARARSHLEAGALQLTARRAGELVAEELRAAQQALGEITGAVSSDDLLGRIFSSFCIGK